MSSGIRVRVGTIVRGVSGSMYLILVDDDDGLGTCQLTLFAMSEVADYPIVRRFMLVYEEMIVP